MENSAIPALCALYLRFPPGKVPDAQAVCDLMARGQKVFAVTYRPGDDRDWIELLSGGLTFDLSGLAGAGSAPLVEQRHGVEADEDLISNGWLCLAPGSHVTGGCDHAPVVRAMAAVGLALLDLPFAMGVAWGPTHTLMSAGHFRRWCNAGALAAPDMTA